MQIVERQQGPFCRLERSRPEWGFWQALLRMAEINLQRQLVATK